MILTEAKSIIANLLGAVAVYRGAVPVWLAPIFWSLGGVTSGVINNFSVVFSGTLRVFSGASATNLVSGATTSLTVNSSGLALTPSVGVTSITCGTVSPARAFMGGTLDVSSFPNLTRITCFGNGITKFQGYGSLTNLVDINLSSNEFNQVGFETLTNKPNLRTLNFSALFGNQYINWIGAFPDLSGITTLVTVNINNSSLTGSNLNFSSLTNLTSLNIHSNLLSGAFPVLPTGSSSKLIGINVGQNKTTRFTGVPPLLTDHPSCTNLVYSNNDATGPIQPLSVRPTLTNFWCLGNQHTGDIPDLSANTALTVFRCDGQRGTTKITGFAGGVPATLGDFQAHNNQLTAAAVNAILAAFVAAGRTTGTRTLRLEGGSNAAPTGQGITDKATLESRGWTVTTN